MKTKKLIAMAFSVVLAACLCTALFVGCHNEGGFAVKVDFDANQGTVTLNSENGRYADGEEASVTVTPKENYTVKSFMVGDEDKTVDLKNNNSTYKFTVHSDVTIKVEFESSAGKSVQVVVSDYDQTMGTVTIDSESGVYNLGSEVTLTITPQAGYEIASVKMGVYDYTEDVLKAGGKAIYDSGARTYKFVVYANQTIVVTFQPENTRYNQNHTWTVEVKDWGTSQYGTVEVSPSKEKYFNEDEVTVTVTLKNNRTRTPYFAIETLNGTQKNTEHFEDKFVNRTFTKTFKITSNVTVDIYFDDLSVISNVTNSEMLKRALWTGKTILDLTKSVGCGFCDILDPNLDKFVTRGYDVSIVKIDCKTPVDSDIQEMVNNIGLSGTPTMLLFHDGVEVMKYRCNSCGNEVSGTKAPSSCSECGEKDTFLELYTYVCKNGHATLSAGRPSKCGSCTSTQFVSEQPGYRQVGWTNWREEVQWNKLCAFAQVEP